MDKKAKIYYFSLQDEMRKAEKLDWFRETKFQSIDFERVLPDEKANWINLTDNDFESLIPVCSKEVKAGKGNTEAIFEMFSNGVVTARDEWVYDFDKTNLEKKAQYIINAYNLEVNRLKGIKKIDVKDQIKYDIKWTRAVKNDLSKGKEYIYDNQKVIRTHYRPFVKQFLYFSKELNEMQYQLPHIFSQNNETIAFRGMSAEHFVVLATDRVFDFGYLKIGNGGTQCLPLYRYDSAGKQVENITDWALGLFRSHYQNPQGFKNLAGLPTAIEKTDIFHYVYAVLHSPTYRAKYEQNLKRDFPRIPLYDDFWAWAEAGKALMELHLAYETAKPYPLKRTDENIAIARQKSQSSKDAMRALQQLDAMLNGKKMVEDTLKVQNPKPKLKANKEAGTIQIDEQTTLSGIPPEAWEYKLGNRSALEWILDQYKESTPSDATIAEKFNTYRFADYKEHVIDLLMRVCTVSVETVRLVEGLKG